MNSEFTIAVHGLVYLNHKGMCLSSDCLAENICTNPARVRKVMAKLKKHNLITTKEGVDGGYCFSLDPTKVSLSMVGKALEIDYISASWRSGASHMPCLVASGMAGIMDGLYTSLNKTCQDYLSTITIDTIDQQIFGSSTK